METHWLEQTEADLPAHDDWLGPEECVLLRQKRFPKRRADWRLGRWTAKRAAAAYLTLPADPRSLRDIEVRAASSGAPELFLAGRPAAITISISHRAGIAACAIAPSGVALGCDLELIEPRDASFVADYFTAEEQAWIARTPEPDRPRLVTLIWSAKESALKALREGLRIDTRSLAVTLPNDEHAAAALEQHSALDPWRPLQVRCNGGEVFQGWRQSTGRLVRTLVGAPPPLPPIFFPDSRASRRSDGVLAV